jgi:hypothetical protein
MHYAAQPAAAPDAAIMVGCGVGWACRRGLSRRLVARAAAQVSREPFGGLAHPSRRRDEHKDRRIA